MKTAVEWLEIEIQKSIIPAQKDYFKWAFDQAKEMELKQRQEDTNHGYSQGWDDGNQNKEPMRPELKRQEQ